MMGKIDDAYKGIVNGYISGRISEIQDYLESI
jgi:hypothetical protein